MSKSKQAKLDQIRARRYAKATQAREYREQHADEISGKIATLDFETDPFAPGTMPKAFAAGFATASGYEAYWNENELDVIQWAAGMVKNFDGIVYAHNGGKFDFPAYLIKGNGKLLRGEKAMLINGRLVKMKFGKAEIRDSYAILPAPLSAYDKGEIDYNKLQKGERSKHRAEILEYLKRDCRSLHELVCKFVIQNGTKSVTAAGAAMASMKELCEPVENLDEYQDEQFRRFYFGGRVQAFRPGVLFGSFAVYDIKSAYPHAMTFKHATGNKFKTLYNVKADKVLETDFVCVEGVFKGCFPVRRDNKIEYPYGHGVFYVTGWEFNAMRRLGLYEKFSIKFVERCNKVSDFKPYVDFHFAAKEAAERRGDKASRLIAKTLVCSGYGKLAQNPEDWREYLFVLDSDVISEEAEEEGWQEDICDEEAGYAIWSRPSQAPASFFNVATAASITGFVRARLMQTIDDQKPLYCDTDSVTVELPCDLQTGSALGDWALEGTADIALIGGKKLYALGLDFKTCESKKKADEKRLQWYKGRAWKMATKGCRLTPAEMEKICRGETVVYSNSAPTISVKTGVKFISRKIRATSILPEFSGE